MNAPDRFQRFFSPRSVAVIGASQDLGSISGQPIAHLKTKGYAGAVYPVNPRYDEVAGYRCYPDVASLPEAPDVAVIAVGAKRVPEAIEALARRGCPFAVILSSGFAEAGPEGARAQREIARVARAAGMAVIGPNCQGYMNIAEGIHVGFGAPYGSSYPKGGLSLTSQSGAFGNSIVMLASADGVGLHHYVSTGNESVTTTLDFMDAMIDDPGTRVIAGYVEGFQDARRVMEVGRRATAAGKPIVIWKVGSSEAGAKAAASHTANLGGAAALYSAAFRQAGIIEADDIGDIADCAKALMPGWTPRGNRLVVVTLSGGAGIAMADRAAEAGLAMPALAADTAQALKAVLPAFAAVANPLDVTAALFNDPDLMQVTMERLARDPQVDMIALALAAASGKLAVQLAEAIVRLSREHETPVFVAWNADPVANVAAYDILDRAGIPRYASPVRCARGIGALWSFTQARQRLAGRQLESSWVLRSAHARALLQAGASDLNESEGKRLLAAYGIPVTVESLAHDAESAAAAARAIGFPVVLKIQSRDIAHKTEAGGVRIGLADEAAVRRAYAEIVASARAYAPQAEIDGVSVQEMVVGGTELILGVQNDPLFGPAVMVGLGGVFAEVMKDVSWRLAPLVRSDAEGMLRELRGYALLNGARGRPQGDVDAVVDTLLRLSALAVDLGDDLAELDINPLTVLPAGRGVRALDALVKPRTRTVAGDATTAYEETT